jgi:hypothetical protein
MACPEASCDQEDVRRRRTIVVCRHFSPSIIVRSMCVEVGFMMEDHGLSYLLKHDVGG